MAARKKKEPPVMTLDEKRIRVSELAVIAGTKTANATLLVFDGEYLEGAKLFREAADALEDLAVVRESYQMAQATVQ